MFLGGFSSSFSFGTGVSFPSGTVGTLAPGKTWGVMRKNSHQLNDTVVTWSLVVEIDSNCITYLFSGYIRILLGEVSGSKGGQAEHGCGVLGQPGLM